VRPLRGKSGALGATADRPARKKASSKPTASRRSVLVSAQAADLAKAAGYL
jgi:hypothetical protein